MLKNVRQSSAILRVQSWGDLTSIPPAVEASLGIVWPRAVGNVASVPNRADANGAGRALEALCIGPADWLLLERAGFAESLLQVLNLTFAKTAFYATDLSCALARIHLDGPHVRALLAKGCALDLHPTMFMTGQCARTRFAGMPVIVRCTYPFTFECIVAQSYCEYLTAWLHDAQLEFEASPR